MSSTGTSDPSSAEIAAACQLILLGTASAGQRWSQGSYRDLNDHQRTPRMTLAHASVLRDNYHTMPKPMKKRPTTMSEVLRQTILDSEIPLLTLSKLTGVQRASISRFLNESQSLRLDCADKLAAHFGLVLVQDEAKRTEQTLPGRSG